MARNARTICGAGLGLLLCVTSTAAVAQRAQPTAVPAVNPYAYIGLYGSQESARALCGNAATVAAAGAAAAQAPAAGCVLPVLDTPPPPVPTSPAPVAVAPPAPAAGFGLSPLLLGLAALGGIIGLILLLKGDNDDDADPVSPD